MTDDKILKLYAPVSGKTVAIEAVPDLVFAQKTIGDGIAIAPSSYVLCAPCDGKISTIHSAHHALTLTAEGGVEILMHIGLDTVMMKGEGFEVHVTVGQAVKKAQPLITFDRALIEQNGKNLLTEIVVASPEKTDGLKAYVDNDVTVGQDLIIDVMLKSDKQMTVSSFEHTAESWGIIVKNPAGFHARPVAVLVNAAKNFESDIFVLHNGQSANAKSVVAIMGLDVKKGDKIKLKAVGKDAPEALRVLIPLVESGLGEDLTKEVETAEPTIEQKSDETDAFYGIPASAGIAVGVIVQLEDVSFDVEEFGSQVREENEKLDEALADAQEQLDLLYSKTVQTSGKEHADIFLAHKELLEDPELLQKTRDLIDKGRSAAFAWQQTYNKQAAKLSEMKNQLLAARANDLRDVGKRVLLLITGEVQEKLTLPDNSILIARDITPSDAATIDRSKVVGFVTVCGGATSHAAILARSMMLPAIAGVSENVLKILNGTTVLLDATKGVLQLNPNEEQKNDASIKVDEERKYRELLMETKDLPAITTDGTRIEVAGNIGSIEGAVDVVHFGGEGVGLLRSEFLFLDRKEAPSEDEQTAVYRAIKENLGPDRDLIIRTLDIGGDKPLPYLPMVSESNPFLGVRGIRFCLEHEPLFRSQIRAILRASETGKIKMMFPMVSTVDELKKANQIVEEERLSIGSNPIEVGIMVEVPSTAFMSEVFAQYVDFFSIGTNDLTQYVMAMDRGNAALAKQADGLNPAVLQAVYRIVQGADKSGKWVGVCGAMAAEDVAIPALIGLGVRELSVPPATIPAVKARIRKLSFKQCQVLAETLIGHESADTVRQAITTFLNEQ